ncbi:TPA: hypothetical protein KGE87_001897 [Escherichia coli]|nr:hypothetical protein [Escherichia coli]HBD0276775.1 hypothetical protein [Escherichia coli]
MAFCNNANLLNVFVRHIANNQLRSLAEVATVAHQLKLLKDDFFASDQQAVAVADCIDSLEVRKKPGGHWIIRDLMGLDLVGLASL